MKEELAALAIGTVLAVAGCGGSEATPQPNAKPEATPTPNATIINMGDLNGEFRLYKSIDQTTGQVCYITISVYNGPTVAMSCPVNPTSAPSGK
jgi:hypothetical protein